MWYPRVHVDDLALGGSGELFQKSIDQLRQRFPFSKMASRSGEFCVQCIHKIKMVLFT